MLLSWFLPAVTSAAGFPSAPTGLTGTVVNTGRVDLQWKYSATGNANGFRVQRTTDSSVSAPLFTRNLRQFSVPANSTTYTDSSAVAGTVYWYRVFAVNASGNSGVSNAIRVVIPLSVTQIAPSRSAIPSAVPAAGPNAPTGLIAITISGGQVNLEWTQNSADEVGFNVERAPDVGGLGPGTYVHLGPTPTVPANVVTYSDTAVTPVTGYWYRVFAVNAGGNSFPSNEVRIITPPSSPQISLTLPIPPTANLQSGVNNTIEATATSPGSTVASAEYQLILDLPAGTFIAHDLYATQLDLTVLAPRAASPVADTTTMPAGLPAGAIAEFEIRGTLSSVNTATGTWQIGTPPITVYESVTGAPQSTQFVGSRRPVVGDAAKIVAYRITSGPGPLVAKTIRYIAPAQPAGTPTKTVSFLFNGAIQSIEPPVTAPGYLLSGEIWKVGAGNFRVDDPDFPAYVDAGLDVGMNATVRFATPPVQANIARQIMTQIPSSILTTKNRTPVFDTTPVPGNVPPGTWLYVIIDGVCQAVDHNTGEWVMGAEQIRAYEHGGTAVFQNPITNWPPGAGDEIILYGRRSLTPGPIVVDQTFLILLGPLYSNPPKPTGVEMHLMYNGVVQAMGPNTWTVGGQTFIVDDPEGKARIDPMPMPSFSIGNSVTVQFDHVGEVLPDPANWAPLTLNTPLNKWTGALNTPALPANRTGKLFLRVTDAMQGGSTTSVPAVVQAVGPANKISFTTLPQTISVGAASSIINVQTQDVNSNPANVAAATTVNLTSTSPTGRFDTSAAGPFSGAITSVVVAAGANSASFFYKDTAVGTPTITAAAATLTSGTQMETIGAGIPSKLVFATAPQTVGSGRSSAVITVQTVDNSNNLPANVAAATTVNLTSSSSAGRFDTSATGLFDGAITSVIVAAGTNSVNFYYKDTIMGSPVITVSSPSLASATQTETVNTGIRNTMAFGQVVDPVTSVVYLNLNVNRIYDASTNVDQPATGGIGAYDVTLTYTGGATGNAVNIQGARGSSPFVSPTANIQNTTGLTRINAFQTVAAPQAPATLAQVAPRIIGSSAASQNITLYSNNLADATGGDIPCDGPVVYTLRRGDAQANGVINITDALFIAQALAGLRNAGDGPTLTNVVNAASAYLEPNANGEKFSITDALVIAQFLAGMRNDSFN